MFQSHTIAPDPAGQRSLIMSITSNIKEALKIMAYFYVISVGVFVFALLMAVILAGSINLVSSILGV
jgi:hypothetical protein